MEAELTVSRSGRYELPVSLRKGVTANWSFFTLKRDIRFSATFFPDEDGSEGEESKASEVVFELERVPSHEAAQEGSFTATASAGQLLLLWDNSYSMLRSKTLNYTVSLSSLSSGGSITKGAVVTCAMGEAVVEEVREEDHMFVLRLPFGTAFVSEDTVSLRSTDVWTAASDRAMYGVDLFFSNRFNEAEAFYESESGSLPIFSLAHCVIITLRAIMTLETELVDRAMSALDRTAKLAKLFAPKKLQTEEAWTEAELNAEIIIAETYIIRAQLLLLSESLVAMMKAGLSIRQALRRMKACEKQMQMQKRVDRHVRGGVNFGLGMFNALTSILPNIVLRVVKVMGFPCDRDAGLDMLKACAAGGNLRSNVASVMLMAYHVLIPSFFQGRSEWHGKEAEAVLRRVKRVYPDSALYTWLAGRYHRLRGELDEAAQSFEHSMASQDELIQLHHLCAYELLWCHMFKSDWPAAVPHITRLQEENGWSKGFYAFCNALCAYEMGDMELAAEHFASVPKLMKRKFGGKTLPVEQYASRITKRYKSEGKLSVPALRMAYLFNGIPQMGAAELTQSEQQLLAELASLAADGGSDEDIVPATVVLAAVKRAQEETGEAEALLRELLERKPSMKKETWALPYAHYELAMLQLGEKAYSEAGETLAAINRFSHDYNFKIRLHFRKHLAFLELPRGQELLRAEAEDEGIDAADVETTVLDDDALAAEEAAVRAAEEAEAAGEDPAEASKKEA
eukprot:PLAT2336.1.p1 GENE.PLAT2336.1~~PLAT2336.1.p1  ORF type:complete len:739 (+),score=343.64 PLAT2336.1:45-2261(+)